MVRVVKWFLVNGEGGGREERGEMQKQEVEKVDEFEREAYASRQEKEGQGIVNYNSGRRKSPDSCT